jgi:hypothetical protein
LEGPGRRNPPGLSLFRNVSEISRTPVDMSTHQNGTGLDAQGKLRVLAGIHTGGGRWTVAEQREQFRAYLTRDKSAQNEQYKYLLASRLADEGYVSASAILADAVVGDYNSRELESFWENDAIVSEYGSGVAKIRERITEDARRRPRQRYGNGQTSITMPSKAAILTDLRHFGATSIDVPVVVQDSDGLPVETVFRVSRTKSGGWSTKALSDGLTGPAYRRAEEIITASMEARRVTRAILGVDLNAAVRDRLAAAGGKPQDVLSSFIKAALFVKGADIAILNLNSKASPEGKDYAFRTSGEIFDRMMNSDKPGRVFQEIRAGERLPVLRCDTCNGPYVVNGTPHTCAALDSNPNEAAGLYEAKRRAKGLRALLNRNR